MKRDVIDIYQFHSPPPASEWDDAFGTMEDLKTEGKIRFYGMGLGSEADALKAIEETGISSLMPYLQYPHARNGNTCDGDRR